MPDSIDDLCDDAIYWAEQGNIGYDQGDRWTWLNSNFSMGTEVDCSSFIISLLKKHGYDTGDATYTGDMIPNLTKHGWKKIYNNGNPKKGDILLNIVHHVALYVGDGKLVQASRGEYGHRVSGGLGGDQDDYETNVRSYYNYPWDCYLRYIGTTTSSSKHSYAEGYTEGAIDVDGWWGGQTTYKAQLVCGTTPDGIVSDQPYANKPLLLAASYGWEFSNNPKNGSQLIRSLQGKWGATVDGFIGPDTIHHMQRYYGTTDDGILSGPSMAVMAFQRALNSGVI